jgi:hypothetical protein
MGFLKKLVKKVKKQFKKVGRFAKKVFKKIKKSKLLKTIALVGAAIVTGGAAVGAFGGTFASSTMGTWLTTASSKILATPVIGTLAKPFQMLGTAVGTGAGKVTDFLGFTTKSGRLVDPTKAVEILEGAGVSKDVIGQMTAQQNLDLAKAYIDVQGGTGALQAQTLAQATGQALPEGVAATYSPASVTGAATTGSTAGNFAQGTIAGDVIRGVTTSVGSGYLMAKLQGDPEQYGAVGAGLGEERGIEMNPLEIAYAQAGVNLNDAYNNLTFGTGDIGYLSNDLYSQPLTGGMV